MERDHTEPGILCMHKASDATLCWCMISTNTYLSPVFRTPEL